MPKKNNLIEGRFPWVLNLEVSVFAQLDLSLYGLRSTCQGRLLTLWWPGNGEMGETERRRGIDVPSKANLQLPSYSQILPFKF